MKKTVKLILTLVGFVLANSVAAQINYMHVETVSGQTPYLIDDVKVLTFSQTDMDVNMYDGAVTPFLLDDIVKIVFDNTVSVNEVALSTEFAVYPNPSTGLVTLSIDNDIATEYTITVYNVVGSILQNIRVQTSNNTNDTYLDFTAYESGVYFLKIDGNNNVITKKIIIQK